MRTRGTVLALVPLFILVISTPSRASDELALATGQRVRITQGEGLSRGTLTGTLRKLDSQAFIIGAESEWGDQDEIPRRVRRDAIVKVEIQTRPPNRTEKALMGLAAGLVVGAAYVVVQTQLNNGSALCDSTRVCGGEVLIGAALGAGVGTVVGASLARPEWTEISLPPGRSDPAPDGPVGPPSPRFSRRSR